MTRLLLFAALAGLLVTASAASAAAVAGECRGLQTCVPVAGPWVRIPVRSGATSSAVFLVTCPRNHVAAGTDALVSDRATDVSFRGATGSPVAPGITTERSVLFTGTYAGSSRARTSFRPLVGCVPANGGGGRGQTIHVPRRPAAVPPGRPIVREVLTMGLPRGRTRIVTVTCRNGGRLLGSSHAVGFSQQAEPSAAVLGSVSASHVASNGRVVARGRLASSAPRSVRAVLQVHAVCTRGGR